MVKATNSIGNRDLKLYVKTTDERNLRKIPVPASPATLLKKLWHGCFPVVFAKFPFLQSTSGRLLLSLLEQIPKDYLSSRNFRIKTTKFKEMFVPYLCCFC